MPRVAVLLPVKDAQTYVAAALRSVLQQDLRDLVVVVVDDGSADASMAEVRRVADARVRIVPGPGRGVAAALEAGRTAVDAEFLCRMDADDVALPGRLRSQVAHLRARPRCGVVGGQFRTISASGRRLPTLHPRLPLSPEGCRLHLAVANCLAHPAVMLRASVVADAGGYGSKAIFEDYDLWLRIAQSGAWTLENLAERVLAYRYHGGNTYRARRGQAARELAPRLREYTQQVLQRDVGEPALTALLVPEAHQGEGDAAARWEALEHLAAVQRLAATTPDRTAVRDRTRQLALQLSVPALRRREPVWPRPQVWAALPRAGAVAVARRLAG